MDKQQTARLEKAPHGNLGSDTQLDNDEKALSL